MNWNNTTLRDRERESIRAFLVSHADKLTGTVLDFGCGKEPYRSIVEEAGGDYFPFDRVGYPGCTVEESVGNAFPLMARGSWDAILCTQVLQYTVSPQRLIVDFWSALAHRGWLVLTGPTNWPEVEGDDLWRFTIKGAAYMLETAGFSEITVVSRETLMVNDIGLSLGWGATGRAGT